MEPNHHDKQDGFHFFWKSDSPFSQWYPSPFVIDGIKYSTAECWMMHQKALLFGDVHIAQQILQTTDPRKQKQLGRCVKNFDDAMWKKHCYEIVKTGNRAKFLQNPPLYHHLMQPSLDGKILVEASPYDTIWGIGWVASDPRARDIRQWRGTNWLGRILTELRQEWKTNPPLPQ